MSGISLMLCYERMEGKVLLVNSSTSLGVIMELRHAQVRIFIHKKSSTITITLSTTPSLYLPVIF